MKNRLLRFYLLFMLVALALFSCENHDITQDTSGSIQQSIIDRKPDERHPVEPNGGPSEAPKGKKSPRKIYSRSSNWC